MTKRKALPPVDEQPDDDELQAWDLQHGESAQHFGWFDTWLHMPRPRRLTKLAELVTASYASVRQISSRHRWAERAAAYDAHAARRHNEWLAYESQQAAKRHVTATNAILQKSLAALQKLNVETLTAAEVLAYARMAIETQRLVLGQNTAAVAVTGAGGGPLHIAQMSEEDIAKRYADIQAETSRRLRLVQDGQGKTA